MAQPPVSSPRLRALRRKLKRCPLCGSLNVKTACECYQCGWYGRFELSPEVIQDGLDRLSDRSPQLVELLESAATPRRRPNRLLALLSALFRRVDQRV